MAILKRKKTCASCGKSVPHHANFCTWCGSPFASSPGAARVTDQQSSRAPGPALEPVPGHGGLSRWARDEKEIARRLDVTDLKVDRLGVRQGLLIGPGERALVICDGEMVDVLKAGNYAVSEKGLGVGVAARLFNRLSGTSHCEVVLVDDGEFPVYLHSEGLDELSKRLASRFKTPALRPKARQGGEPPGPEAQDSDTKGTQAVRGKGIDERLGAAGIILDQFEGLAADFPDNQDLKKQLRDAQGDYGRMLSLYGEALADAYEKSNLLRVRTHEGHYVNLGLEIYFRIEGNMEFVNNLMRNDTILYQNGLIEKVSPLLENLLQSVVKGVSVDDLYGNLPLNERINDAFIEELAPTLSGWGLRITRTVGQKWDLAEYKQIENLHALLKREMALNDIEKERTKQKHGMDMFTLELESEQALRKQADGLEIKRGELAAQNLEHQSQVDRERREREAQLEAKDKYDQVRHKDRTREQQLEQERLDADARRDIERRRAETEQWQVRASFMAKLPPAQILAMFADHNPQLLPALEAYWRSQAGEREIKLSQEFQERLQRLFGNNEKRMRDVYQAAIEQMGQTAQASLASSQVKILPHGDKLIAITAKPGLDPSGRVFCNRCQKLFPREEVKQETCPECLEPIDAS